MLLVLSLLQAALVMMDAANGRRVDPPTELKSQEYRNEQLLRAQKALNSCRDGLRRCEALATEKARQRVEQFKQFESYHLDRIKSLGGEPDPSVGKLTIQDFPTPQQLQENIQRTFLKAARGALATTRATIKKVEAKEDGADKTQRMKMLRDLEAMYVRQLEQLERGSIQPVMPIVPRSEKRQDKD